MADVDADVFVNRWPKRCARCQRTYTKDAWEDLKYLGVQHGLADAGVPDLELRFCTCGGDFAITCPSDINVKQ